MQKQLERTILLVKAQAEQIGNLMDLVEALMDRVEALEKAVNVLCKRS